MEWNNNEFNKGTGNGLLDFGLGGLSGFSDSFQKKGYYMPMSNWAGNGLARSGIQYFANPNYRDYASGGRMLGSLFGGNNQEEDGELDGDYGSNSTFNALGKLSTMGGKIGDWAANLRGAIAPNGKMLFERMFSNIGDFGNKYQRVNPITNDVIA